MSTKKKLLMHICCAPCAASMVEILKIDYEITFFWYNPNIAPDDEYALRKNNAKRYADQLQIKFVDLSDINYTDWQTNALTYEVRCHYCYDIRITKVADYAKNNGFNCFTTTLLSSPYQKHEYIKNICYNESGKTNVEFCYLDGRSKYYEGKNALRLQGYYLQKYCGCLLSKTERENSK